MTGYPWRRRVLMNQDIVARGGRLFLVGNKKLYRVFIHIALRTDVKPRIEGVFQNE